MEGINEVEVSRVGRYLERRRTMSKGESGGGRGGLSAMIDQNCVAGRNCM